MIIKKYIKNFINLIKKKEKIPVYSIVDSNNVLKDKVAIITGGSGGIGFAIAKKFVESGAKVIICGTKKEKLIKLIENNKNMSYLEFNIKDVSSFQNKVKEAIEKFGTIDILVNSAGIHSTNNVQDFFAYSENEFDNIIDINFKGTYFFTREVAKYMVENKIEGHILNISSSTSLEPAWSPYRISKWAMNGFTKGLADRLLQYGIIVNGIAPGSTATQLLNYEEGKSIETKDNKLGRMLMPEEVAELAKLLVSKSGDFIVGETIFISGGRGNLYYPTYN